MSLRSSPFTFVVAIIGWLSFAIPFTTDSTALAQDMDATALSLMSTTPVSSDVVDSPRYEHKKYLKRSVRKPAQVLRLPPPEAPADASGPSPVPPAPVQKPDHYGFSAQMRDLVMGGTDQEIQAYRAALPTHDIRLNRFEIQAAPLYIYNDSKSANWARTYQTSAEGFDVGGKYWFSPTFAASAEYTSSFGSAVPRAPGVSLTDSVQDSWLSLGFRFRRFYGSFERPTHFTLGLDYNQYQHFSDLHDGDVRNRFTTTGPRITMEALIPTSERFSWRVGVDIVPFGFENEDSPTNPQIVSGAHSQTMQFGMSVGPEYLFDRGNRAFMKLSGELLHTSYDSTTSYNSPVTGTAATAENITNTFVMFEIGYIWGN